MKKSKKKTDTAKSFARDYPVTDPFLLFDIGDKVILKDVIFNQPGVVGAGVISAKHKDACSVLLDAINDMPEIYVDDIPYSAITLRKC